MSERDATPEVEILTREEVRDIRMTWHGPKAEMVVRLCATVEFWHRRAEEAEDGLEESTEGETADAVEIAGLSAANARLSALVARMREALELAAPIVGDVEDGAEDPPVSLAIAAILADPDGQHAAEELRLLRAAEEAARRHEEAVQEQKDDWFEAAGAATAAWRALRAFREKSR